MTRNAQIMLASTIRSRYDKRERGERMNDIQRSVPMQPELPAEVGHHPNFQACAEKALKEHSDVIGFRFSQNVIRSLEGSVLEFEACVFERCTFQECAVKRMSFVDCVFDHCDLSNMRFENVTFQRVLFLTCRMLGMEIGHGAMSNTDMQSCAMDYVGFVNTKMERTRFCHCRLHESLWSRVELRSVVWEQSNLTRAQWDQTSLNGADLTSCVIEGIQIHPQDIRGAIVTSLQAIGLSLLLGIVIRDESSNLTS